MRTTVDLSEREHALFTSLARERRISFSRLMVELALRGLKAPSAVAESKLVYEVDEETGLPVFDSGHVVTDEDVKALEDEELDRYGPFA